MSKAQARPIEPLDSRGGPLGNDRQAGVLRATTAHRALGSRHRTRFSPTIRRAAILLLTSALAGNAVLATAPSTRATSSLPGPNETGQKPTKVAPAGRPAAAPIYDGRQGAAAGGAAAAAVTTAGLARLRPVLVPYTPPAGVGDVPSLRTQSSRTLANADGSFTQEIVEGRINYRDASGAWQPINLALVPASATPRASPSASPAASGLPTQTTASASPIPAASSASPQPDASASAAPTVSVSTASASPSAAPSSAVASASPSSPAASSVASASPSAVPSPLATATALSGPTAAAVAAALGLQVASDDQRLQFGVTDPSTAIASLSDGTRAVRLRLQGMPSGVTPAGSNDIEFTSATTGVVVAAKPIDVGLEFSATFPSAVAPGNVTVILDTGGMTASLAADGATVLLKDPTGAIGGTILAPQLYDQEMIGAPASAVVVTLAPAGTPGAPAGLAATEVALTYTIDPTWFADPARQFPVVLDPPVCIGQYTGCQTSSQNFDTFILSGLPNNYPTGWTTFRVGYDTRGYGYGSMRGLISFAGTSLGDGGQVTSATASFKVCCTYGPNPTSQVVDLWRATAPFSTTSTWNQANGNYDSSINTAAQVLSSGTMNWDVTGLVREEYTRRPADWKAVYGFYAIMSHESSSYGDVEFYRYNDGTGTNRPRLTINYLNPHVAIDFDPALGPTYAPSTMLAGQTTLLPAVLRNQGSAFTFNATGTDHYELGYRWLDTKGKVLSSGRQALTSDLAPGASESVGLSVASPGGPGQYTLRLDLVHMIGSTALYASDWATPSLYYSRNKKTLQTDDTRWVGSSVVERDEFPITVLSGDGSSGTAARSVRTGDGGTLAIDLGSKNLAFSDSSGLGAKDLVDLGLDYGYNATDAAPCSGYQGVLGACGWFTNLDERLTPGSGNGNFTYQAPDGSRSFVDTDPDGQLVSGAAPLLSRVRATLFDENRPSGNPNLVVAASGEGFAAASGQYVFKAPASGSVAVGTANNVSLNAYPTAAFFVRSTSAASSSTEFLIYDATRLASHWYAYTVGSTWTTGVTQIALGGTINGGAWSFYSRNLLSDVLANLPSGWTATDDFQVTSFQIQSPSGGSGSVYLDAWRLEAATSGTGIDGTNPTWTGTTGTGTTTSTDTIVSSASVQIPAESLASSPTCTTSCFTAIQLDSRAPFAHWWWKKAGGSEAAIEFYFKDTRTGSTCQSPCAITYYAGAVAPAGAPNAIQVTPTLPTDWSRETRNILEDARTVLALYNDGGDGSPDPVQLLGDTVAAVDGSFLLIDDLNFTSIPDIASSDRWGHPDELGLPNIASVFTYDFKAEYADGSTHYFNPDGLLERIADRDGNAVSLDWNLGSLTGQSNYSLAQVRAASDTLPTAGGTAERRLIVSATTGTLRTVKFSEWLGTTTTSTSARSAVFTVATAVDPGGTYGINDLVGVSPARHQGGTCGTPPSGCVGFTYTDTANHRLFRVADPRWDGSTSGANDFRLEISRDASFAPTAIVDRSHGSAALLKVLNADLGRQASPLYRRAMYQDASAAAAGYVDFADLTPEGEVLRAYAPLQCTPADCSAPPPGDSASLASDLSETSAFDGLARVDTTYEYRCPGVTDGGCAGTALVSVTRHATNAAAKVDNYADALAATEVAWSQSSDQYFASMRDSGGTDPDLYRTTNLYNGYHEVVDTVTPATNQSPDYLDTIWSTYFLQGYWRMNETSGTTMADSSGAGRGGTYVNSPSLGQPGGLLRDSVNRAVGLTASSAQYATVSAATLGTISGTFTVEAWAKAADTTGLYTIIGTRGPGNTYGFDLKFGGNGKIHSDLGSGSGWLNTAADAVFAYQANRWYHIVEVVDTGVYSIYVDGTLVGSGTYTGTPILTDSTHALFIGQSGGGAEFVTGAIDEVAVYNKPLDGNRIHSHYLAGRAIAEEASQPVYDREGHVVSADDEFLANPGFESGLTGWQNANGATTYRPANPVGDPNLHNGPTENPPHSYQSLQITNTAYVNQDVQLVPGQTFRVQFWHKSAATGVHATFSFYYWDTTSGWSTANGFFSLYSTATTWTSEAWDLTVPMTSDGRLRLSFWNDANNGIAYFDDVAIVTDWSSRAYAGNGLPTDVSVLRPCSTVSCSTIATVTMHAAYAAGPDYPAIYQTTVTQNYLSGQGSLPDQNVASVTTFDAWGRTLETTDADGARTAARSYSPSGNQTDLGASTDALGNQTSFGYDAVGNQTSVQLPGGEHTTTAYDLADHATTVTDAAGIVAKSVYNNWGELSSQIANFTGSGTPSGPVGLDNLTTTYTYDEFGRQTKVDRDTGYTGALDAQTATAYDLLGNIVSATTYAASGGASGRTTTNYFETSVTVPVLLPTGTTANVTLSRTSASGVQAPSDINAGPPAPTAPAPVCPGTASTRCTTASVAFVANWVTVPAVDMAGRVMAVTDTYGKVARTYYDLAGHPVETIANYADGTYSNSAPDTDLVATSQYDLLGNVQKSVRPPATAGVAGLATVTARDALERATTITSLDNTGAAVSVTKTVYTPGGRADLVSLPDSPALADTSRTWSRTLYDLDGRAIKTLTHVDTTGAAGLALDSFEGPSLTNPTIAADGVAQHWDPGAGTFISAGATATEQHAAADAVRGTSTLDVAASAPGQGVEWKLDNTYLAGHTYSAAVWVKAPAGMTVRLRFGTATDPTTPATADVVGNGAWQKSTALNWSPTANRTGAVLAASVLTGSGVFRLDDAMAWDGAAPERDAPTSETVYNADGQIVATVAPPGTPGNDEPMVTTTGFDPLLRPTSVTVDKIAGTAADTVSNLATTTTYDALGRVASTADPRSIVTTYQYDRLGRATATIENDTAAVRPASPTADNDVTSTFAYDALGELTGYCPAAQVVINADGTFDTTNGCNPAGATGTAPYQKGWHWSYDAAGHRSAEIPPVNTALTALDTTSFTYDAGGRLATSASVTAGGVTDRHTDDTYDGVGRLTSAVAYQGAGTASPKVRTDTTWNGDGTQASTTMYLNGSGTASDALAYGYDAAGRPNQLTRGSTVVSAGTWNADGTLATRTDGDAGAVGTSSFTYDWAKRIATATLPTGWQSGGGSETFAYRADGLLASRTWNTSGSPMAFSYDAAKRPVGASMTVTGGTAAVTQTYDRGGNVTSEGRTMPSGVTGDAGTATQSFTYDGLSRLTGSSGLAAGSVAYAYDLDSNRVSRTGGPTNLSAVYDRTDELVSVNLFGAAYDAYGNLTSDPEAGTAGSQIAYGYDLAGRLVSITPGGGATTTIAVDALGRPWTRTTGASVDTYSYAGTTDSAVRVANTGGSGATTDSVVDSAGDRLGTKTGATVAWLLPDLHGSVAAALSQAASSVTDAIRYDGYGQTTAVWPTGGSAATSTWKYQGKLDLSPSSTPLYDFSARNYSPGLGAFTNLDSLTGSAQAPGALNRFLYAAADPTTLVDPTGHKYCTAGNPDDCDRLPPDPGQAQKVQDIWKQEQQQQTSSQKDADQHVSALPTPPQACGTSEATGYQICSSLATLWEHRGDENYYSVFKQLTPAQRRLAYLYEIQTKALAWALGLGGHDPMWGTDIVTGEDRLADYANPNNWARMAAEYDLSYGGNAKMYTSMLYGSAMTAVVSSVSGFGYDSSSISADVGTSARAEVNVAVSASGGARFIVSPDGTIVDTLGGKVPDAVVLGKYPAYIDVGAQTGARTFSISSNDWFAMSPAEQWARNQQFLDQAIARGSEIRLATPLTPEYLTGSYLKEIQYLIGRGYVPSVDGTTMIPAGS